MKKLLPVVAVLFVGCACSSNPEPTPPGPVPDVTGTEYCQAAEDNLEAMQCMNPDGTPMWVNADGEEFHVTCVRDQEEGGIFLNPQCIAEATSCEEANGCPQESP